MAVRQKGERTAMSEMRKHIAWYTAGMPHSAMLRRASSSISTLDELENLLDRAGDGAARTDVEPIR